jgi:hypothetical protein
MFRLTFKDRHVWEIPETDEMGPRLDMVDLMNHLGGNTDLYTRLNDHGALVSIVLVQDAEQNLPAPLTSQAKEFSQEPFWRSVIGSAPKPTDIIYDSPPCQMFARTKASTTR